MLDMRRREFITLLGAAAAWPLAASAQQQPKMLRVGFVIQPREAPAYTNFLKRMAELGYQEGRNFTFDYIQTPDVEGYERNYRELAARKVDVFLAVGTERALRAALLAAEGKPIVLLAIDFDPVRWGYVASLSRPGGSVTGIFVRQLELAAKRVEIAHEAFPHATVVGIAFDTISSEQRDAAAEAARKLGLKPRMIEVKGQQDYGGAFSAMDDARGQPIILPASPMFFRDRETIAQALLERRIPSIAAFRENLEAGALISYGFDLMGLFYDIASYVHRIAGGAKPSDMPIEQSPRFYMAVSLKTAASLALLCRMCLSLEPTRCASEAPRVHHASRRRGDVAARGAGAAAGDAGSRVSWLYLGGYSRHSKIADGVPPSVEKRSCRRTSSATRAGLGLGLPIIGKLLACMMQHTIDGKCHERHCRVARIDRPE
jgi:putative tryptophan/tyrosine transport system substrate-binding protein